jgi:hypothetical protein
MLPGFGVVVTAISGDFSQPNVKNKWSYFAYKNNILGKSELLLSTWESRE